MGYTDAARRDQARVLEEVLVSRGMLVRVGPDPANPDGSVYRFGVATPETIAAAIEEMEIRCGWTVQDTLEIMKRLANGG